MYAQDAAFWATSVETES